LLIRPHFKAWLAAARRVIWRRFLTANQSFLSYRVKWRWRSVLIQQCPVLRSTQRTLHL